MKRIMLINILLIMFIAPCTKVLATTTVVWEGNQTFSNWSNVVNVNGNKFSQVKPDDIILFSITTTSSAQFQLSYGNNWTNFDGLDALPIKGNYELVVTSTNAQQLKQGVHIKGIGYTLTKVSIVSNDGSYTTQLENLFGWEKMLLSGATKGERSSISISAYGGIGWYWPEDIDLSIYRNVHIQFLQPLNESLIAQLFFNDNEYRQVVVNKGSTQCNITLNQTHKKVYSVNMISEKPQTISLSSVNLIDKEGNEVVADINNTVDAQAILTTEYYNMASMRINSLQKGINIIKMKSKEGKTITRKVVK